MALFDPTAVIGLLWAHLWWLPPALLLLVALKALLPRLKGQAGEAAIARVLARRFPTVANDVILPDGRGGLTQIDHLALTHRGILVVETKTYSGSILGRPAEPTWTQVVGRQRHAFRNPILQNRTHQQAIAAFEPGVPRHGLVVFAGNAKFPKGIPEGACNAAGLSRALEPFTDGEPAAAYCAAWERLMGLARTDRAARTEHLQGLEARFGGQRTGRVPAVIAAVAIVWLGIGWLWTDPFLRLPGQPASERPATAAPTFPLLPPPPPLPTTERPVAAVPRVPPEPPLPPSTARGAPSPAPTVPAGKVATLEWADPNTKDDACALATTAYLIERTAEARLNRTRVCGDRATDP